MESMKILLVEDNFEHLRLTKYILRHNNVPGDVYVVRDGQEALDYLYNKNQFADPVANPKPNLVLLDLNIPRINGREVLKQIKSDETLRNISVVVLSSSDREEDVSYSYEHGAVAYISKSAGFERLNEALSSVHEFAAAQRAVAF
jgi:CheY-like chemotaxis protein